MESPAMQLSEKRHVNELMRTLIEDDETGLRARTYDLMYDSLKPFNGLDKILVIGHGLGSVLDSRFAHIDADMILIEPEVKAFEESKNRLSKRLKTDNVTLMKGDPARLRFLNDQSIDLVLINQYVLRAPVLTGLANEIFRVLAPSGELLVRNDHSEYSPENVVYLRSGAPQHFLEELREMGLKPTRKCIDSNGKNGAFQKVEISFSVLKKGIKKLVSGRKPKLRRTFKHNLLIAHFKKPKG